APEGLPSFEQTEQTEREKAEGSLHSLERDFQKYRELVKALLKVIEDLESETSEPNAIIPFPQQDSANGDSHPKIEEPELVARQESSVRSEEDQPKTIGFWHSQLDEYGLSVSAIAVLTHLVRRCGNEKGRGSPSVTTIAKARSISRATVIRAIHE